MPWLDKFLHKNPLIAFVSGIFSKKAVSPVLAFALKRIEERKKERCEQPEKKDMRRDFLARFLDIQESRPDIPDS